MTTPELTDEQLLLAWQELTKEQQRRFQDCLAPGPNKANVRVILDELDADCAAEDRARALEAAQAKAVAALPEKDRTKALAWIARRIVRPLASAISSQDVPAAPATSGPREGGEPNAPKPATPPPVFEPREGVVRIQTGSPDHASPQGYCEIARWTLNARGELVLRNEDGKLLREHRLEGDQDPADMALRLLRAWASERKSDYSGRRLPHPDDAWMA